MSSKKKIRKQVQQEDLTQVEMSLIEKYKRPFIFGCVLMVAIVIGYNVYSCSKENSEKERLNSRATAELMFAQGNWEEALNGDSLQTFKGFASFAADDNVARAYAGICCAHLGDWENAVAQLEKFDAQNDETLTPLVLSALANSYANLGNTDKAIATFKKAAEKAEASIAAECLAQAAEIYVSLGNKAEARTLYQQIKDKYSATPQGQNVERNLLRVAE